MYKPRIVGKHEKIRASSSSVDSLPRGKARSDTRQSIPDRATKGRSIKVGELCVGSAQDSPIVRRVTSRQADSILPNYPVGSAVYETPAMASSQSAETWETSAKTGISNRCSKGTSTLLVTPTGMGFRGTVPIATTASDSVLGCVHGRVGSGVSERIVSREMGRSCSPHQLVRTQSSVDSVTVFPNTAERQVDPVSDRQYDSSSVCKSSRRNKVKCSSRTNGADRGTRKKLRVSDTGETHKRQLECTSGSCIKGRSGGAIRMEAIPKGFQMGVSQVRVGQTRIGTVCKSPESSATPVRISVPGFECMGDRRVEVRSSDESGMVCVPSVVSTDTVLTATTANEQVPIATSSPMVSTSEVDAGTAIASSVSVVPLSGATSLTDPTALGSQLPQRQSNESEASLFGERRLRDLGFSEEVIDRLVRSHATSTKKQYKSQWALFVGWATDKRASPCDPTEPSVKILAEFLTWLFQVRGLSTGSVINYKSAISFFWKRNSDFDIPPEDKILRELIRSFKRERPSATKRSVTWDLRLVLEFFSSERFAVWDEVSDKDLTLKTVFLIALASGKRRGELHALTRDGVKEVHGERKGLLLHPAASFISKTHMRTDGLGALKPVFIPALVNDNTDNDLLCPVTCLNKYLSRSAQYRAENQKQLFISWQRNCTRDVRLATISSYIKQAVLLAYNLVDDDTVKATKVIPHTVRHVATSLKAWRFCSLNDILEAGSWVSPNTFISHYLTDFTTDTMSGLSSLGGFVAGGTQI